jgi:glycosyltransferase involved in cell wall biosynthesis
MMPELFGHASGSRARLAGLRAAKRLTCRRAERVIAISETTKRDVCERYGLPEDRVDAIPLGNSLGHLARREFERPHGAPYLLYVGNRSGYKNWSKLVKAVASSASLRDGFDLVCFGGGPLAADELALVERAGMAGQVHLAAGSDERLAAYYRHAAAYVCPSLYEGFGLPCVEAMGFGCPVVTSDGGSLPEVVGRAGVYFDPADLDSMRDAIERVTSDGELAARLKPLMAERERRFRWPETVAATLETYRRVTGEDSQPSIQTRKAA